MNEDVSAMYRLAACMVLTAQLIFAVLAVTNIGLRVFNEWSFDQALKASSARSMVLMSSAQEGEVGGLVIYKLIESNAALFKEDGVVIYDKYSNIIPDYRHLLKCGDRRFEFELTKHSNGLYSAVVREVDY